MRKNLLLKKQKLILFFLLVASSFALGQTGCWDNVYSSMRNSIFVKSDGSTWVMGNNSYGQLGTGNTSNSNTLINLNITGFVKFAVGDNHTLAIKTDGTLWAWGQNNMGQLGDGTTVDKNVPIQVGNDNDWKEITTSRWHSTAIKNNGTLWSWGYNGNGVLGNGATNDSLIPIQIGTANNWSKVKSGYYHTLAIKSDGTLWAWGFNGMGQLGDGTVVDKNIPTQVGIANNWIKADGGNAHSIALKADGTLWTWGYNASGQLGDGTIVDKYLPTQIGTSSDWQDIASGGHHNLATRSLINRVYTWGSNLNGRLGYGFADSNAYSFPLGVPTTNPIIKLSASQAHNNIIDSQNNIFSWGANSSSQLGNGSNTDVYSPTNYINCDALAVETNENSKASFKIYPNPAKDFVSIKNDKIESFVYQIFDLSGKLVLKGKAKSDEKIDVRDLQMGNYIVQIESRSGEKLSRKIIKN